LHKCSRMHHFGHGNFIMRAQTYAFSLLTTYFFARGATVPFPHPLLLESVSIRQGKWERVHAFFW
jgi:hypothetical protein